MFSVMEFQDALCALLDEPEECYYFFSTVADHKVRLYQYLIKYYKPDILIMHDDYGSSGSMFMSPNSWRELIKPHLQRVINCIPDAGVLYEHHCCGYFAPILGEIADMWCSTTNTMHISNHPKKLKKEIGHKMCFVGGFDTQYMDTPKTTEAQIRESIDQTIDDL
ncbi:uroporphyrinogen decarboxylase family protein [Eubacterium aggregans]|uniref:uroporphyrinogen decarboxylase family protein n=1 Tax=Eubacterium aggregans TaxID=81409 RepID=UPI003F404565